MRIKLFVLIFGTILVALFFQNCGKAGFESLDQSSNLVPGGVDPKLNDAPFPIDVSINQIAQMTCPITGSGYGGALSGPYFNLRFGAFDPLPAFTGFDSYGAGPQAAAGLQINSAAVNYMNQRMGGANTTNLQKLLQGSRWTNNKSLAVATIYNTRNSVDLPRMTAGTSLLETISEDAMISSFIASGYTDTVSGTVQFKPVTFFPLLGSNQSLVGSIYKTLSDTDLTDFQDNLYTHQLHFGFVNSAQTSDVPSIIRGFIGPTGNPWETLYGKSYRIQLDPPTQAGSHASIYTIHEFDLSQNAAGIEKPSSWICLDYTIVRDIDRRKCIDGAGKPVLKKNTSAMIYSCPYFANWNDMSSYESTVVATFPGQQPVGVYSVCPPQPLNEINQTELQYLRRFLPADQFEINTRFHCIVAKQNISKSYQCYDLAQDGNFNQYVQYAGSCTGAQCPAQMTMCIRN